MRINLHPNAEVNVSEKKVTQNISDDVNLNTISYTGTNYTYVDAIRICRTTDITNYNSKVFNESYEGCTRLLDSNGVKLSETPGLSTEIDKTSSIGKYFTNSNGLFLVIEKGTTPTINHTLNYQLKNPKLWKTDRIR